MGKAVCSDCSSEVETNESFSSGTETYQCTKCGSFGVVVRKEKKPIFIQFGKEEEPILSVASAMILPKFAETHVQCQHCKNYVSSNLGTCPICKQLLR